MIRTSLSMLSMLLIALSAHAQVVADFSANQTSGCSPLTVQFINQSTGPVSSYQWDFGNGNTSNQPSPGVIYVNPGTYTVSLIVTDGLSRDTLRRTAYITVFAEPTADLSGGPIVNCAPAFASFTDQSTPGSAPISQHSWDFGDGNLSSLASPSHLYNTNGTFDVTLVVTDTNGCSDNIRMDDYVVMNDSPAVTMSINPQSSCQFPVSYGFSATPLPGHTYVWDFGDGSSGAGFSTQHAYATNGQYLIRLTVTNGNNCTSTLTQLLNVATQPPIAGFNTLGTEFCAGERIDFANTSANARSFLWRLGDGTITNSAAPSHVYQVPGKYTITLIARDGNCRDTLRLVDYLDIKPGPNAAFTSQNRQGCSLPLIVDFQADTNYASFFFWDFGDSSTATVPNPTHVYQQDGFFDVTLVVANVAGCRDSVTFPSYTQVIPPTADFAVDTVRGCAPLRVDFLDLSVSPVDSIVNWIWDFGDGGTYWGRNATHMYTSPGVYDVQLVIVTRAGCRDTVKYRNLVRVGSVPNINIGAGGWAVCPGDTFFFNNQTAVGTAWLWDFGDGTTSSSQNPYHLYGDTGTYDVSLIVDYHGCRDTLYRPGFLSVRGAFANFVPFPDFGCSLPFTTQFTDLSVAADHWYWDFGDGGNDTIPNPTHTYGAPGTYVVELTVTNNAANCSHTHRETIEIQPMSAAFTVNWTQGCAGSTATFNNLSLNASRYYWDFGDGAHSTAANPTHVYNTPGTYSVMLIARNAAGCADTMIQPSVITVDGPVVNFFADVTDGCVPLTVNFSDSSTSNSPITQWLWEYGGGGRDTTSNPTHTFTGQGGFFVRLTVTDARGCSASLNKPAYIRTKKPRAYFYSPNNYSCASQSIRFIDLSTPGNYTYLWDFGDGTTSSLQNPTHVYSTNGNYTVSMTLIDPNGCSDTQTQSNYVRLSGPSSNFSASPTQKACPPLTVNFNNLSSQDVTNWYWDFGDGTFSTLPNPSKIYTLPGKYDVWLAVTNANGCTDTLRMADLIDISGPSGSFSFFPKSGCSPLDVNFVANAPGAVKWTWDFGDGSLGAGDTVSHVYFADTLATPVLVVEDSAGCVVAIQADDTVKITAGPDVGFRTDQPGVCLGRSVQFFDTTNSKVPLLNHLWDFGDGNTSTLPNPVHTYAAAGSYPVQLTVTNANGCTDSLRLSVPLVVSNPPQAQILPQPPGGCAPLSVAFQDSSITTFPIVDWQWDFGDGRQASNLSFVSHTYNTPGTYQVKLKIQDSQGCEDSVVRPLDVTVPPVANFTANNLSGCAPKTIQFTDLSTSNQPIADWFWDFGDGNTSTQRSPQHTYLQNGTFTVSLTVTNQNGCAATEIKSQYIVLQNPISDFVMDATRGCPPIAVNFTATPSSVSPVASFLWDFGDGTTSNLPNPSHTYTLADTYAVSLVIVNGQGCRDTVRYPRAVIAYEKPQADFLRSDSSLCLPGFLQVSNNSRIGSSPIASYRYDFDNGQTAQTPMANTTYSQAGIYDVKLLVRDFNGCVDSVEKKVTTYAGPQANFRANDSLGCGAKSFTFFDLSGGGNVPVSWRWNFGDGSGSIQQQPSHFYSASGNYTVSLKVTDANGCSDSLSRPNYIRLDGPQAAFSFTQTSSCANAAVAFTDNSYADTTLTSWQWDFGDGNTGSGANPSHTYARGGQYPVSLTVTNVQGCASTLLDTVTIVTAAPLAAFNLPDTACAPFSLSLRDRSQPGAAALTAWAWDLDNGNTANTPNPVVNYANQGTYSIRLRVVDANGCVDSLRQSLTVVSPPVAAFLASDSSGCALLPITFTDLSGGSAPLVSHLWEFGNGDTSQQLSPTYTYPQGGTYDVTLTVRDTNGCVSRLRKPDLISMQAPVARFSLDQARGCQGLSITFTDLSQTDTTLVSWLWDFGDSLTSRQQNPVHSYAAPGRYTVSLTIMDATGCGAMEQKVDTIEVFAGPQVDFGLSDTVGCVPLVVNFFDSTSSSQGFGSRQWRFGNLGATSLPNPSRAFTVPGTYPIWLKVTDNQGCSDSARRDLVVFGPPQVDFGATDSQACAATNIQLLDQTQSGANLVSWRWNLGDGTTSAQQFPQHTYTQNGSYSVSLVVEDEFGCKDSLTKFQFISIQPAQADFTLSNASGCTGTNAQFSDLSFGNGGVTNWLWDFGDGTTSTQQHPAHSYTQPGRYTVKLRILDAAGCSDTITKADTIRVFRSPQAEFSLSDTASCAPLSVSFTDLSVPTDAGLASWSWDFGTGNPAFSPNPTNQFVQPGRYAIRLTVTDSNGCPNERVRYLRVYEPPRADFGASDSTGCASKQVSFLDRSTSGGGIVSWQWDFGDGGNASQPFPTHTYLNNGLFDVSLKVSDRFGCEDSVEKRQYIRLVLPMAAFGLSSRTGCTGTPIAFTDQSSSDSSIVSWLWDFGDGTTSTQTNPQHSYTQAGTYAVSLTVTDAKGCAQTETLPQAVVISDGPQVSFGLSDTAGCAPLVVQFSDASSAPAGIAAWRWNFGNGGSAASANPLRAYNQPGAYQVSLTVTDSIGCQASLGQSLHVYAPPLANFSADDTLGCASHITNFLDLSSSQAGLSSWQWDFGDGNGSTQQFPTHTYLNNGTFNVGLTVTDRFGCVAQLTRRQYIRLDAPDAAFGLSRRQGCTGADISFQDLSQTDTSIIGWLWDFGDGTTSLTPNPTHRYIQAGSYTVSLTITDAKGCIDTEVLPQAVRISDGPAVAFTLSDTAGCAPLLVQFNDSSSSPTGLRSWQWQLGNGSQAQGPNPSRSYGIPGRYPIRLVVTDSSGCQDSLTQQVRVYAPPSANFGADDSLGCAAKLVNFVDLSSAPAGISSWTWDFGDGGNASQQFPSHTYLNNGSFDVKLKVTDRFGCTDSLIRRKYINLDAPQAAFNLSQRQACNSLNVQFTDLSQADTSLLSWLWDFGDGSTATVPNPSHLYTQPGVYAVSLTIVDAKGCSNTEVLPAAVRISNGPQVDFALSDTAGCAPLGVQFSDLSSSPTGLRSWRWDLGNGSSAAGPGPVRAYQQPGQYLIQLVVTDSSGCQDSLSKSLQVYAPPVANFGADDSVGCANKLVNFSDLSTSQAGITSWTWDFGDGGNANQPFPTYTYQNNGRYDVSLRVTDRFGCTDSLVRRQYIQLSPPQAAFSLSQGQGCQGMQVAFSDLSRSDTSIVSWLWDFGDGSTSGLANPSHRFTQAGQYPVSLTITDAWGCMDTELLPQAVTVSAGPQVAFGLSDTAGCAPLRVSFTDQSSAGQGIRSWAWDMGNGTQATGSSPSRAFSQPGSYTIQLTVTDSAGCQASLSQPLNVYAPPQADFSISDSLGCAPRVVSLLDLSSSQAGLVGWRWDFGNGDSSLQQFPTYVFSQNGNYDVALTVTDRFGCQDQLRKQQLVKLADPVADFSLSQAQGCPGMPVSFIDLSSSDTSIVAWYWDFGDGTFSTQPQPSHTYSSPGRYTVRLQITDAWGCSDSEQKVDTIEIFSLPVAAIGQSVQVGCRPLPVQFADSSQQGSAPITRWAWDLGNQSLSSLSQPQHTYSQAGTYPIRLRVTDANGCADSVTSSLLVHDTPTAAFMAPDTLGCAPDSLAFLDQSSGPAPLVNWQWNFGDGGAGSGPQPSHRYQAAGSYDVSLRIIDQNGCEDSLTRQAYIRLSEPMADFGIDTLTACPGTQVNFRDRSFSDTTLLSWRWDFGDGTVRSNGPTQSHRYAQSGQYVAQLTITDALGCRDSMTAPMAVNVLAPPVAAIQGPQQGCEPLLAQYQAQGQGGNNWQWYLDGQAAGGGSTIAQNFLQADTHQLSLVVIDNLGCRDTASQRVMVHPLPEANFRVLDSLGCAPMPVRFRDLSQGDLAAWLWDFGDGNFSTLNNPIHSYQQDGAYTIRLKVTTVHGCLDSMVQFDQVNMRRPQVDFSIDHDEPCAPLAVDFSAQARFDTGIADWFWVFGDGNSGKGNPIAHSYVDPGIYSVSLIATDSLGCRDTVSYADLLKVKENNILPAPPVHRVTVHSDDRVDIVFRPTSSPDFEHYRIYRETPLGSGQFVQIHQTSFRDDTTFSDYGLNIGGLNCVENVYCYKVTAVNDCGSETELADAPAHCTIELKTRVAPDRMLLNWTPYAGWEVAFYEIYRVGSYDLSSAQLLDMVPGQTLQYVDASARCSNIYTYRIKAVGFGGQQYSWSDTARARNQRTANLEPNEVVRATVESNRFVRVEWLPIQMSDLTTIILERRSLEYPEWTAIELLEPGSNSYRDEQVAVDRESYSYRITARDSCGFLSEVSNLGKSILLKRGPAGAQHLLSWSAYEAWGQGVDYYELEVYNDFSQSWELVDVVPADTLSYDVSAIYLDQPEYCFRVRAHESGGHQAVSLSNQVCLPVEPEIFAPNAFTPNSDGYNDVFYLKGVFISEFQLLIFDRWGRKVFEARDINEAWDGTHKGQAVPEGVYTFIARGIGYNGLKHEIDGTVTVIR